MTKTDRLLYLALGIIVLLRATFIFIPAQEFWGINFMGFLPVEFGIILCAVSVAAIVWALLDRSDRKTQDAAGLDIFSRPFRIAISIAAGVLFFFCSIPYALLGDGGLFFGDLYRYILQNKPVPLYREPLTMLTNSRVYAFIYPFQHAKDIVDAYRVTGAVFGILYVAAALKFSGSIRASYPVRVLAFALFATVGGMLLFFGYVENYAPQFAFVMLYIVLLVRMFRTNGSPLWPGVVLVFCCLFHLQNVLLIPSFAVALVMRNAARSNSAEQRAAIVYKYAALSVPVLLLCYALFQWRPIAPLETGNNPFIPFFSVGGSQYTLFSPMHIADIFSEHLLLAPVAIAILLGLLLTVRKHIRWMSPEMVSIVVATLALEAFLIGGNMRNGMARDWDVVSTLGILITFITVLSLEDVSRSIVLRSRIVVAAGIVAVAGATAWVAVNISASSEIARYKSLLQYHRSSVLPVVTRYGYESLRKAYQQRSDWVNELAIDETIVDVLPWHFDFSHTLSTALHLAGNPAAKSSEIIGRTIEHLVRVQTDSCLASEVAGDEGDVRIASPGAYPASLGDLIVNGALNMHREFHAWSEETTDAFADTLIALHPRLPYGYEIKGTLRFLDRDTAAAAAFYRRSAALDDHRSNPLEILALFYQSQGKWDSVRAISKRVLARDDANNAAANMLYVSLFGMHLQKSDIPDLQVLVHWAQSFIHRAKEREYPAYQVQQAQTILVKVQSGIDQLNGLTPALQ